MDEHGFVDFLQTNFRFSRGFGIGDDASAVPMADGFQLITKDVLVEGVHFSLDYYSLEELALKSLAVNVSDIAAMGGEPQYFYIGIGFPSHLGEAGLKEFYKGLAAGCRKWNVELAGGDYSSASHLFISITLIGFAKQPVYRNGAKPGHLIGITGATGESALGLHLLGADIHDPYFRERHVVAEPEVEKGRLLAGVVSAMLDVSDGIVIDLKRILEASNAGGTIFAENIPLDDRMREMCSRHGLDPLELALTGGEDYALLFTVPQRSEGWLRESFDRRNLDYYVIGEVTAEPGLDILHNGAPLRLKRNGYDHLTDGGDRCPE